MRKYIYIHYLRGIAAILVVVHHILSPNPFFASPLPQADFGAAGVAIFFVISGFILYTVCRHETVTDFIARRLIRVVPLYWLATSVKFVLINAATIAAFSQPLHLREYLLSLLFVPHRNYFDPAVILPMLYQGWTLNFEMLFYAVFAAGLCLRMPLRTSLAAILCLVALGLFGLPLGVIAETFTRPILLLFLAGLAIGYLNEKIDPQRFWIFLPIGAGLLAFGEFKAGPLQQFMLGFASILIVLGAVSLERTPVRWTSRLFDSMGQASYSIYLTHTFVFAQLVGLLSGIAFLQASLTGYLVIVTAACVALSIAVHLLVERPMLTYLKSAWNTARAGRMAAIAK